MPTASRRACFDDPDDVSPKGHFKPPGSLAPWGETTKPEASSLHDPEVFRSSELDSRYFRGRASTFSCA